jgi:hypothetical protein
LLLLIILFHSHNSFGKANDVHGGANGICKREYQPNAASKFGTERTTDHEVGTAWKYEGTYGKIRGNKVTSHLDKNTVLKYFIA